MKSILIFSLLISPLYSMAQNSLIVVDPNQLEERIRSGIWCPGTTVKPINIIK
jgi:hypothetical protein